MLESTLFFLFWKMKYIETLIFNVKENFEGLGFFSVYTFVIIEMDYWSLDQLKWK